MNESASKSSLTSPSGKPSTANSTGSPNGRKTRTVLVARTITDEPAEVMPAATGHNSAVSMVVNQHHSRDARSGKLASYAALGGAEDVERFDKFLAEQRGQPSASELRAAATSPHHMAASMKRRTMSRIQLEGIDGKLSNAEPAGDAVTRKLMQQELENDARKRREEAVAHRKWLNSLPIHERVAQQRQRNALRKWRQMSRDWETFKARAARKLGKTPQELVMSRASTYREQREMYDTLQKARPLNDKVGEDIWLVSLRDEGTRYVPVGNIFSGLFCPIRESTKIGPRVRRPLDYYNSKESHPHEISRPMSKLEKRSLNLLERKKWRLRKQLEILQPHEVDRSATTHLSVKTSDLFAWASGGTNESNVDGDNELSVQAYSAGIDEVSRGQRQRSYASPSSPMSVVKEGSPFSGPSLQIAYVTDADEEPISNPESNGALVGKRPETCLPPLHLSFYTTVDEQVQRSLSITNDGSTVVHYQWWRAPFEDENADLTIHLRGNYTRKEEQESERFWTTSVSKLGGTILPQETQQFVFTFESSKAGVFLEKWLLDADPQPRICLGTTRVGTDMDSVELPVEVRLSCVAEDNFVGRNKRKLQLTRVEQKEGRFFVANLVDEILDGVKPPEPKVFNELSPREDVTKFYEKNDCNEFSDVYFSSDLVRDCRTLYERAQGILRALSPVKDLVIEEENLNENDALDSGGAEGVEKPNEVVSTEQSGSTDGLSTDTKVQQETTKSAPLPAYLVEEWDWRLETLCELCKMADEAQNLHIGQLTEQLKKEIEEVEEEEENEDDDEDEIDDAEEDDDEEGARNEGSSADKSPRISPREQRKIERLARRKAIEDEIGALQSKLQETFDMMRFSGYTAPYNSTRLQERMHERIGNLCSETSVVCEIANMVNAGSNLSILQAAKVDGVGKLLMCAIDEAIGGDQDHQALLEQERRRIQNMWLADKASYLSISEWIAKDVALTNLLPPMTSTTKPQPENTDIPPTAQDIDHFDNSGVILMQIDLDLAPWFSLEKVETKEAVDGPPKLELAWRFSRALNQHATYVPAKVVQAAESLDKVLSALSTTMPAVHTVLLVSELSQPPLTRQMLKLLRSAAQDELKVKALATNQSVGELEESKSQGGEEKNDETEAETMNTILQRLSLQLSFRDIAPVVQRAIQKEVMFCSDVEEVQAQIDFSRKELLLNSSVSFDQIENTATSEKVEVDGSLHRERVSPRILLLEHLDNAGILTLHAIRQRELAASKPATPAPPEMHKPAASGKKSSVAVPGKGKSGTQAAPSAPTSAPIADTPPPSIDLTKLDFVGNDFREQGFMTLRNTFTRMTSACVLDGIPSPSHESVFSFTPKTDDHRLPPPIFAGPTLSKELESWSQSLQPALLYSAQPRVLTAVVGGKCLESKLRLIDGLLEYVREIYFVGEVAMSLYRVLHTKQARNSVIHSRVGMTHGGDDAELYEDADLTNVTGNASEGTLEGEQNEPVNEKEIGDFPGGRAHFMGMWDLLVPAVEKLQQKASRKCVHLLLPIDLIVGETPLEEQDLTATTVDDDDEDEDEDEVDEEADEDSGKGNRKQKTSEMESAQQKLLVEPNHADVFKQLPQGVYEGERAHVVVSPVSPTKSSLPVAGWRTFKEVTAQCLPNARVIEGKRSILASLWRDDADEETEDESAFKPSAARFEYDWTFRVFDIGPISMDALIKQLKQGTRLEVQAPSTDASAQLRGLIISGVCGAVEFHEFCAATKQLLHVLHDYSPSDVFIAGGSTARWLQQMETEQLNYVASGEGMRNSDANTNGSISVAPTSMRKVVDDRAMRNAHVLKQIVAAKPHPILANLVSSDSS